MTIRIALTIVFGMLASTGAFAADDAQCISDITSYCHSSQNIYSDADTVAQDVCKAGGSLAIAQAIESWRRTTGDYPDTAFVLGMLAAAQGATMDCITPAIQKFRSQGSYPDSAGILAIKSCATRGKPSDWPTYWKDYWNGT
jgi:pectin methylesterase-like acyl-CoA thioesterase